MARKQKSKNLHRRQAATPPSRPADARPEAPGRLRFWLLSLFLVALTLAAFLPCLRNGFISYDDPEYVTSNPHVRAGFTWSGVAWAFTDTGTTGNWHPLTWLSHMLDCEIFGTKAWGHHLTNVLFHAINTWLLFAILMRITGVAGCCFFVAALFGLHPLHVQSVAWVAERKDVLGALFWFLSLWAYVRHVEEIGNGRNKRHYFAALGFFALGLMAKPMLVTLPFTLLLLDFWPLARWRPGSARSLLLEKAPFFALSMAVAVIAVFAQEHGGALVQTTHMPLGVRVENALISYTAYIGKLAVPVNLAVFYPLSAASLPLHAVISAALLLGIFAAVIVLRQKHPYLPVGWFWFVGTLVPVIGLVQVGSQSMADRYSYVPAIGLFIMIAWGARECAAALRFPREALMAAGAAVACVFAAMTVRETGFWRDGESLFRRAIAVTGENATSCMNLGYALEAKGEHAQARTQFRRAVELDPADPIARFNLGTSFVAAGQWEEAEDQFEEAVRLKPDYALAHYNLGFAWLKAGRTEKAAAQFEQTIKLLPGHGNAHYLLGNLLIQNGRLDEAITQLTDAARLLPGLEAAQLALGAALVQKGRLDEADGPLREAIRLNPGDPNPHNYLGVVLLRKDKFDEAASQFREALKLKPDFAEARANLSLALGGEEP